MKPDLIHEGAADSQIDRNAGFLVGICISKVQEEIIKKGSPNIRF